MKKPKNYEKPCRGPGSLSQNSRGYNVRKDCGRPVIAKGLCRAHYRQLERASFEEGNFEPLRPRASKPAAEVKSDQVAVSFTPAMRHLFELEAARVGIPLAELIRRAAVHFLECRTGSVTVTPIVVPTTKSES